MLWNMNVIKKAAQRHCTTQFQNPSQKEEGSINNRDGMP
jgi:hypothetical protein